jgi:hypothetical protein
MIRFRGAGLYLGGMQMTTGAVDGVPSLIDFDRNQFAAFPPGHELLMTEGRPSGFQVASGGGALPLNQLAWLTIPFGARVYQHRPRRAPRQ